MNATYFIFKSKHDTINIKIIFKLQSNLTQIAFLSNTQIGRKTETINIFQKCQDYWEVLLNFTFDNLFPIDGSKPKKFYTALYFNYYFLYTQYYSVKFS